MGMEGRALSPQKSHPKSFAHKFPLCNQGDPKALDFVWVFYVDSGEDIGHRAPDVKCGVSPSWLIPLLQNFQIVVFCVSNSNLDILSRICLQLLTLSYELW